MYMCIYVNQSFKKFFVYLIVNFNSMVNFDSVVNSMVVNYFYGALDL